jgi:hypothetical protein
MKSPQGEKRRKKERRDEERERGPMDSWRVSHVEWTGMTDGTTLVASLSLCGSVCDTVEANHVRAYNVTLS